MTDPTNGPSERDDDDQIREALAPLQNLEPRTESRIRNQIAVTEAMARSHQPARGSELRWWHGTVSMRVPVAVSLAVLVVVAFAAQEIRYQRRVEASLGSQESLLQLPADVRTPLDQSSSGSASEAPPDEMEYFATETYLCGIGTLESESIYTFVER